MAYWNTLCTYNAETSPTFIECHEEIHDSWKIACFLSHSYHATNSKNAGGDQEVSRRFSCQKRYFKQHYLCILLSILESQFFLNWEIRALCLFLILGYSYDIISKIEWDFKCFLYHVESICIWYSRSLRFTQYFQDLSLMPVESDFAFSR